MRRAGKHWKFKVTNDGKGLIPARAGKTGGLDTSHVKEAAHPRAGGENESGNAIDYQAIGSSPRGRGKLADLARSPGERRLIPARAGKTGIGISHRPHWQAHPRAGGENGLLILIALVVLGSSPRGRGKPITSLDLREVSRLIPARAGKTHLVVKSHRAKPAHPRAGGENARSITPTTARPGSSPRGRGKPKRDLPCGT